MDHDCKSESDFALTRLLSKLNSGELITKHHALNFYELNYDVRVIHSLKNGVRQFCGEGGIRSCRFCGGRERDGVTTFRNEAHAIPRLLGNKTLFIRYECDACNRAFSRIENDLGNYLKPYRTLSRMSGYKGVPTIKQPAGKWRISGDSLEVNGGINVSHDRLNSILVINEDKKRGTFTIPRDPYVPLNVYKSLVKTGISIMPEEDASNFRDAIEWLGGRASFSFQPALIGETFVEGWYPLGCITAILLRRKWPTREVPHMLLVLSFVNYSFQIAIPSPEQDRHLHDKLSTIPPFPTSHEVFSSPHKIYHELRDFTQDTCVRGENAIFHFGYEQRIELSPDSLQGSL